MGVRLLHHGGSGHIVVHEPKDDSAYHGQHQERHYACNVVSGARSDGFVDKTLAQPYHQQSERNAPGSRQNPNGDDIGLGLFRGNFVFVQQNFGEGIYSPFAKGFRPFTGKVTQTPS